MRIGILTLLPLLSLVACSGEDTDSKDTSDTAGDTGTDSGDSGGDSDTSDTDTGSGIPAAECVDEGGACVLTGEYTQSMRLTADKPWLLRSGVLIGDDTNEMVLEIEPGTWIYGEAATDGVMIIRRGSRIEAVGTAADPIVFTSDQPVGSRSRGDWGGLVLNGRAPINACTDGTTPCEAEGEGNTGTYGGDDWTDNSGTLKYVIVEFGGTEVSPDNEVNGISMQAVGSGTSLDYVQVHNTLDDCIEFWGGAATVKHFVCTSPGDDGIDYDLGFEGKIQFAVVQQAWGAGNNGFEGDNNPDVHTADPQTTPTISNVTLIGEVDVAESNFGMLLRRGIHADISNVAVDGFSTGCLALRDQATYDGYTSGDASMTHTIMACDVPYEDSADETETGTEEGVFEAGTGNQIVADLNLKDAFNVNAPDFRLNAGSPLATGAQVPADTFFESVSYIGAFDDTTDWTAGWTHHDAN